MSTRKTLLIFIALIFCVLIFVYAEKDTSAMSILSPPLSKNEKVKVKGATKKYVDAKLAENNNVYKIEDLKGAFDNIHDEVDSKGDLYVSCADVKVGKDVYDIDYYVKKENGKYTVVKEVLGKLNGKKINRILWEKK
ncbi:MAG: hypothetical protein KAQ85_06315 [Thermodesulfovibrionia bacterium]|nr:hypothetical protein [Thermodesulfovibrionia bacterium]